MVQIPVGQVLEAARALRLAGRWELAEQILAAAAADAPAEVAALAMARAQVAVDSDFWRRGTAAGAAIERAAQAVAGAGPQPATVLLAFDLELLRLRQDYFTELLGPDGPRFGPDGRDQAVVDDLALRAGRMRDAAPDRGRGGAAAFCAGLIADNLRGDPAAARPLFSEALAAGEQAGDDLLAAEALRHLCALNHDAGDRELALGQAERAVELRQRAGCVPLTLAQQLLAAEMTAEGGRAALRPVAAGIRGWAAALGLGILEAQATALAGPVSG